MRSIRLVIVFLLFPLADSFAQSFNWNAGFDGFLDNREYYSINNTRTIFGSRIWGEIGADLGEHHRFMTGINYLYEFGHSIDAHLPGVIMYYQYNSEQVDFLMGSFPRRDRLAYPLAFLSDTLNYFRPNIKGAIASYKGNNWHQSVFIDWMSRKTDERPERFIFGLSGHFRRGVFSIENHFLMAHLAAKGIPDPDFNLRDNGGANVNLGLDLSGYCMLDTLVFKAGGIISLDRIRDDDPVWQTPAGFLGQLSTRYRSIGLDALYYRGQGHTFFYGDPFYKLDSYGRIDLYVMPFRKENISLKINFVMHIARGQLDYSQQLLMSIAIK
jgi:hypothetical protein